jgi:hypothetical protein
MPQLKKIGCNYNLLCETSDIQDILGFRPAGQISQAVSTEKIAQFGFNTYFFVFYNQLLT